MTNSGDVPTDGRKAGDHSIVEYALRVTDTVVWEWYVQEDDIMLYPPSQTIFEDITGVDEFLSQVHSEDRGEVLDEIEEALEETGSYTTEFRLASDADCWIAAQGTVEHDDTGDPKRLTGVGQDISERKHRELEFRRLGEYIAETELISEIGGWELDTETNDLRWTTGSKRIHEVDPEYDPTLEDAIDFYHPEDRPTIEQAVQRCLEHGEPYSIEARLITAEGRERWIHITGEREYRGDTEIFRGVIRDISQRKIRDQRLMVLNRVLRHNIRNSLSVVLGNAEILRNELVELKPIEDQLLDSASFSLDEARSTVSKISRNAERLVDMADDARRLSGALERGPAMYYVEVTPVVKRLASNFAEQYPEAAVTVDGTDVGVRGDVQSLEMALRELLENAILHSQAPSPTVEISLSKAENNRVRIRVVDTGPGIPEMEREVLERGAEEPLLHGHGLGLWMVNWLMVKLGGSVSIEENDPTGTIVTLTLPAASEG